MAELKITVVANGGRNSIHLKDVSEDIIKDGISSFFLSLNTQTIIQKSVAAKVESKPESNPVKQIIAKPTVPPTRTTDSKKHVFVSKGDSPLKATFKEDKPEKETKPAPLTKPSSETKVETSRSKQVNLLNSERTLSHGIEEKMAEALMKKKPVVAELPPLPSDIAYPNKTVRCRDGRYEYQCHYNCSCGQKGKFFVEETRRQIYCYDCNKAYKVEPAVKDKPLKQDGYGNFFVAYKEYNEVAK